MKKKGVGKFFLVVLLIFFLFLWPVSAAYNEDFVNEKIVFSDKTISQGFGKVSAITLGVVEVKEDKIALYNTLACYDDGSSDLSGADFSMPVPCTSFSECQTDLTFSDGRGLYCSCEGDYRVSGVSGVIYSINYDENQMSCINEVCGDGVWDGDVTATIDVTGSQQSCVKAKSEQVGSVLHTFDCDSDDAGGGRCTWSQDIGVNALYVRVKNGRSDTGTFRITQDNFKVNGDVGWAKFGEFIIAPGESKTIDLITGEIVENVRDVIDNADEVYDYVDVATMVDNVDITPYASNTEGSETWINLRTYWYVYVCEEYGAVDENCRYVDVSTGEECDPDAGDSLCGWKFYHQDYDTGKRGGDLHKLIDEDFVAYADGLGLDYALPVGQGAKTPAEICQDSTQLYCGSWCNYDISPSLQRYLVFDYYNSPEGFSCELGKGQRNFDPTSSSQFVSPIQMDGDGYGDTWYNMGDCNVRQTRNTIAVYCCKNLDCELVCNATGTQVNRCCGDDSQDDPDVSEIFCENCGMGYNDQTPHLRDYNSAVPLTEGCCGDDFPEDCANVVDNRYLCWDHYIGPGGTDWNWSDAENDTGAIFRANCANVSFVADGAGEWIACDDSFNFSRNPLNISGHDYLCYEDENASFQIAECCGNESCLSTEDYGGITKDTGDFVNISGTKYYCAEDGSFGINLDGKGINSCEDAGFAWTGMYCCSEEEDIEEYYNDAGGMGSCWNKIPIGNEDFLEFNYSDYDIHEFTEVIVVNGTFLGCAINVSEAILISGVTNNDSDQELIQKPHNGSLNESNDFILSYKDYPDSKENNNSGGSSTLVQDQKYCTLLDIDDDGENDTFCSYKEVWSQDEAINRTHLSFIEWTNDSVQQAECCLPDDCWNGTICVGNQRTTQGIQVTTDRAYRCIDGTWELAAPKKDWRQDKEGYCPFISQCLVNPDGSSYNTSDIPDYIDDDPSSYDIVCINDKQFIGNHYCDNGTWTTRTKLVALKLLSYVEDERTEDNYALFCDDYIRAFNNYNSTSLVEDYFDRYGGANDACVLRHNPNGDEEVVIGIALNEQINETVIRGKSFLRVINHFDDYCDTAFDGDDNYLSCDDGGVWYNDKLQIVIFSKTDIDLDGYTTILGRVIEFFRDLIYRVSGIERTMDSDYSFINRTQDYSKIYLERKDTKVVRGVIENLWVLGDYMTYMAVDYENFDRDVCASVQSYIDEKITQDDMFSISCNVEGLVYGVQAQIYEEEFDPEQLVVWKELTAKLRIE